MPACLLAPRALCQVPQPARQPSRQQAHCSSSMNARLEPPASSPPRPAAVLPLCCHGAAQQSTPTHSCRQPAAPAASQQCAAYPHPATPRASQGGRVPPTRHAASPAPCFHGCTNCPCLNACGALSPPSDTSHSRCRQASLLLGLAAQAPAGSRGRRPTVAPAPPPPLLLPPCPGCPACLPPRAPHHAHTHCSNAVVALPARGGVE